MNALLSRLIIITVVGLRRADDDDRLRNALMAVNETMETSKAVEIIMKTLKESNYAPKISFGSSGCSVYYPL